MSIKTGLFFFLTFCCIIIPISGILDHYCNMEKVFKYREKIRTNYEQYAVKIMKTLIRSKPTFRKKCPHSELFWSVFPTFGMNTERCRVSVRIQCECGKMRTRITPNMDSFHAVLGSNFTCSYKKECTCWPVLLGIITNCILH